MLPFSAAPEIRCRRSNVRCVWTDPTRQRRIDLFWGGFGKLLISDGAQPRRLPCSGSLWNATAVTAVRECWKSQPYTLRGQYHEAAEAAALFRQQYPSGPAGTCEQLWLIHSTKKSADALSPGSFRYSTRSGFSGWEPDRRAHPPSSGDDLPGGNLPTHLCILTAATATSRPATALLQAAHSPQPGRVPIAHNLIK